MSVQQVASLIKNAKSLVILTGAGVSKESGVPTFRDAMEGLWAKYDPQQLATPRAFVKNPQLVWDWYAYRRELVSNAKPNAGHFALAHLEKIQPTLWVITQNVDDLHEQAGSTRLIRLHGNIAETICYNQCQGERVPIDKNDFVWDENHTTPPKCPHCHAYLRPNVVWFEETLPRNALQSAFDISSKCDVMLVIGTSGLVSPASQLPHMAENNGATLIEINPEKSEITPYVHFHLKGASGVVLPALMEAMT
ncbi:MAG TPA: NAD-dependent deacylase [Aggregatilineales bacterium]|nr:NAD-dependent deacylase [Aggregatilineales bacterium]